MSYPHIWLVRHKGETILAGVRPTMEEARGVAQAALHHSRCASREDPTDFDDRYIATPEHRPYGDTHAAMAYRHHFESVNPIILKVGVRPLMALVPFSRADIRNALAQGDQWLNTLPLPQWDGRHQEVRRLAFLAGEKSWSLGQSGSLLKNVAIHHMAPFPKHDADPA